MKFQSNTHLFVTGAVLLLPLSGYVLRKGWKWWTRKNKTVDIIVEMVNENEIEYYELVKVDKLVDDSNIKIKLNIGNLKQQKVEELVYK